MPGINTKVVSHYTSIHPSARTVAQRKQKVGEEKKVTIKGDVKNLYNFMFISETRYPTWLTNMVLVRKANKTAHYLYQGLIPITRHQSPD